MNKKKLVGKYIVVNQKDTEKIPVLAVYERVCRRCGWSIDFHNEFYTLPNGKASVSARIAVGFSRFS